MSERAPVPSRTRTRRMGSLESPEAPATRTPPSGIDRRATARLWGAPPDAPSTVEPPHASAATASAGVAPAITPPRELPEGSARTFRRPATSAAAGRPGLVLRVIDGVRRVTIQRPVVSNRSVPTVLGLRPVAPPPSASRWRVVGWALVAAVAILLGAFFLAHRG